MLCDRARLRRQMKNLDKASPRDKTQLTETLQQAITASQTRLQQRTAALPVPQFPDELPVCSRRDEIAETINSHQVVIICGETGSGKTTQLPKICLQLGRGTTGLIGHTQPRRLAARSVATRIADELNTTLGESVGYKVRFSDHVSNSSHIKLMTDGILLAELQHDRLLQQYDTLIIDEAHERSLNIDFLLGYIKGVLPKRPDLKLIITSATIDPQRFADYFDNAPIVEVSGRGYPVEQLYRPLIRDDPDERDRDLQQGIVDAVDELSRHGPGDILVFLPGEREIRETAETLRKHHPKGTEILPLYARLSAKEQQRVFDSHGRQRIVLATNVAETSLTVPGIRYVIDSGLARISRYSVHSKVQCLPIEAISQASARQRAGRCGRTSSGICIRLYSEDDFNNRPAFTTAEIQRTNLAAVILQMLQLRLGNVESFPFIDPPQQRYINDGYKLLQELNAVDDQQQLTAIGKQLARLPVDPRLGRMVLAAGKQSALTEVLVITSALTAQDPRERPLEQRQAADEKHQIFKDERSDFISLLKLWTFLIEQNKQLSNNQFRKLCKRHFISYLRWREWQDIHRQLRTAATQAGLGTNAQPADYDAIHRALLSGLLSHIGFRDKDNIFQGARNRKFLVFPGSQLHKKPPKWLMAAELVQTTRLFARTVARIEPEWIEQAGAHLLKRDYYEPHWQARSAQVAAFERISLYGLIINPRRRVNYGPINPSLAREIFIREALVEGSYRTQAKFFIHNRKLIAEIQDMEAMTRRRDLLIDDDTLYRFYDEHIPQGIYNGKAFEKWLKSDQGENANLLRLSKDRLLNTNNPLLNHEDYPQTLQFDSLTLPLAYHFEPGHDQDGVTLTIPLAAVNQVDTQRCEWLVPGMLVEKLTALIKTLPKPLRRNFVPAPDFARASKQAFNAAQASLTDALGLQLQRMTGVEVPPGAWQPQSLPAHLLMRYRIVDPKGNALACGRDLKLLQTQLSAQITSSFAAMPDAGFERDGITDWDFSELAEQLTIDQQGIQLTGYPALVDMGDSLALRIMDTPGRAARNNKLGVRRLFMLRLKEQVKYLQKNLPDIKALCLQYQSLGSCNTLIRDIIETAFNRVFIDANPAPRTRAQFEEQLEQGRPLITDETNMLCQQVGKILNQYHKLRKRLQGNTPLAWLETIDDIQYQLGHLVYPGFIGTTPARWLGEIPRYLQAIEERIDKLEQDPDRDRRQYQLIAPWWQHFVSFSEAFSAETIDETLVQYRWMLEEFRVSLFAQKLGTAMPISVKRLEDQWTKAHNTIHAAN